MCSLTRRFYFTMNDKNKVISPDALLYEGDKYVWTWQRAKGAWETSMKDLREELTSGSNNKIILVCGIPGSGKSTWISKQPLDLGVVYFDATFTNKKARKPLIKIAKEFDTDISIIVFKTPLEVCIARNSTRPADRIVPNETMDRMNSAFSKDPPKAEEGFKEVIVLEETD